MQVLVFGSITEDVIRSLQRQPSENAVEKQSLQFGSLDSATLRSVGILNTELIEPNSSKGFQSSKLVTKQIAVETVSTKDNVSPIASASLEENKSIHNSYSSSSCGDGIKELEVTSVDVISTCISPNVADLLKQSTTGSDSSEFMGRLDTKDDIPKASDVPTANIRDLLPRGLKNLGNLCFLNATLQALLSCSPFVQLLQELRTLNIPEIGYPTLHAFVEFISDFDMPTDSNTKKKKMAVLETGRPFSPVMFEPLLNSFTPDVPHGISGRPRQEDAQEFLSFVMDQMHDEFLKLEGQLSHGNGGKSSFILSVDDDDNWETVGRKNKTAVTRTQSFFPSKLSAIFGGQLRSVVKARGSKASVTIQPFLLLHLDIFPDSVFTIEDALHMFTAPEMLEGYRKSAAAGKTEIVSASKSVKLQKLPNIMILHLMRFSYGSQGSTKLLKPVHFPLELVIRRELLVSPSLEGRRYELVATITHHGREPSTGHYTADARNPSGQWLRYDDASVTAIGKSKVLHDQAYILFYKEL
ncbi:hypothetical protein L1049_018716 [Liquidambar formosana]|uniref:Ubiquitin carboxyl-terminal hydrolase n=1 Tax=Liquidambar formosana TaxID=63359 RepID=A0AAP0RAG6_LIQFO